MPAQNLRLECLDDLRHFVNETLCEREQLEPGCFPLTERILFRNHETCGIYFCVHGPRSVKVTAIWETDRNMIFFYSSSGERYLKVRLSNAPVLASDEGQPVSSAVLAAA